MHPFKVIIKGSLDFGIRKSYDMMIAHFQKRLESYYKNDIMLKGDSFFNEENMSIEVSRSTYNCSEKTWKNTICLLRELRSFAVAGELYIWVTDERNALIANECIVPQGDKLATTEYLRGVNFLKKEGSEEKAIESLNKAIEKYERYSQAFERRGVAHSRLNNTSEALMDFTKSISLNKNADAYFGMANEKMKLGDFKGALVDFQLAIDNAVPYQPIFWMARRVKGECHLKQNDIEKALFELKLVSKRVFKESDPNYRYRKQAWKSYGECLMSAGRSADAAEAFKMALSIEKCSIVADLLRSTDEKSTRRVAIPA